MSAAMAWWVVAAVLGTSGLVLLIWSVRGDRARGRRRCPKCWYDMSGAMAGSPQCPECGRTVRHAGHWLKTRRRWGGIVMAMVTLLLTTGAALTGQAQRTGWEPLVPTTGLIVAAPWVDHPWPLQALERRVDGLDIRHWQWRWVRSMCIDIAIQPGDPFKRGCALDMLARLMGRTPMKWNAFGQPCGVR
jgi:hypothetical protein